MITPETARKLKDAGFPIIKRNEEEFSHWIETIDGKHITTYLPNLSELIEACGDDFFQLIKAFQAENPRKWFANNITGGIEGEGSTPEEAVGRLWLAIHETDQKNSK